MTVDLVENAFKTVFLIHNAFKTVFLVEMELIYDS